VSASPACLALHPKECKCSAHLHVCLVLMLSLRDLGYSCHDIISTMFKVTKSIPTLSEHAKLEFIKVRTPIWSSSAH